MVRPGGVLSVNVDGFAPWADVIGRIIGVRGQVTYSANKQGRVHVGYQVPTRAGEYEFVLYGPPRPTVPRFPPPASSGGDAQTFQVSVPLIFRMPFAVIGPRGPVAGVGGVSAEPSGPGPSGAGNDAGGQSARDVPAQTGSDLRTPLGAAIAALIAGCVVLFVEARMRRRRHDSAR